MEPMKSVLVDLDGVLADYHSGWLGIHSIGDPIPGAVEFTKQLAEFARVVIFTTRCKAYPSDVPGPDETPEPNRDDPEALAAIVKTWLDKHGFTYSEVYIGQGKPPCAAVVDDRAVSCRPQADSREFSRSLALVKELCGA